MTPYPYGKNSLNNRRFLIRNQVARRKWHNIFQVLKEKNCQPGILYLEKILFRNERKSRHSQMNEN